MHRIAYRTATIEEIDLIRPLWEKLNEHHHATASVFRSRYEQMTFNDRRSHFLKRKGEGDLQTDLAMDPATGKYVGYCISSLSAGREGEIESIFVAEPFRHNGIGTALVTRALAWMDAGGAVRKRVSVGAGNESAWAFYRRFGFFPRMTVLEQTTAD